MNKFINKKLNISNKHIFIPNQKYIQTPDPNPNPNPNHNPNHNQNNSFNSLLNIENYKKEFSYSMDDILKKHGILLNEYLNFIYENINLKNKSCNNFIIIRGIETISHVFSIILYYSKNIDLAFYHGQKAFYFYVEFICQITDEQHTFLQLNSRDASLFVYKKTIFDINNDYTKNTNLHYTKYNIDQFEILYEQSCLIKQYITYPYNLQLFNKEIGGYKFQTSQFDELQKIINRNSI